MLKDKIALVTGSSRGIGKSIALELSREGCKVIINYSEDYPLRLDFPGDKMGMGFILAPRVENN